MTVVKINTITMPHGSDDALAERFAPRAHASGSVRGGAGVEALHPEDSRYAWLNSRWPDDGSFGVWRNFQRPREGRARPAGSELVGTSVEVRDYTVAVTRVR